MTRMMMNRLGVPAPFAHGSISREMDRLFRQMLSPDVSGTAPAPRQAGYPGVNVWEDPNAVYVEAELPGFEMDQIDVAMLGSDLTISGERRPAQPPQGAVFHRRERPAGRFSRTIHLGVPVNPDGVTASLQNGVLLVTVPKAEAAKPRKIEVKPK